MKGTLTFKLFEEDEEETLFCEKHKDQIEKALSDPLKR